MAIFHYPFTNMKLSASYALLSLIISFINPDQGLPSTLEARTKKVLSEIMNNQILVLKRKVLNSSCWKEKCANTRKAQVRTKARKKKEKKMRKNPSWKWSIRNSKKRQKDKSQKWNPSHDDPWSSYPQNTFWAYYHFFRNPEPWPTLCTWKAHFDQTWILKLNGLLLEEFSQIA